MRKTICAILMGSCALAYANAQTLFPVTSPDGSISLVLKLKEKGLYYEVEKKRSEGIGRVACASDHR